MMEAEESNAARELRLQRKLNSESLSGPSLPAAGSLSRIYYWEPVAGADGYRNRTRIDKSLWKDYWRNRAGQRRYDEFYDEWDICTEFGDDAHRWEEEGNEREEGPSGPSEDVEMGESSTSSSGSKDHSPSPKGANPDDDALQVALSVIRVVSDDMQVYNRSLSIPGTVHDVLLYRYGLHPRSRFGPGGSTKPVKESVVRTSMVVTRDPTITCDDVALMMKLASNVDAPRLVDCEDYDLILPPRSKVRIKSTSYSNHY